LTSKAETDLLQNLDSERTVHTSSISELSAASKWKWALEKQREVNGTVKSTDNLRTAVQLAIQKNREQKREEEAIHESIRPTIARDILQDVGEHSSSQEQRGIYQTVSVGLFKEKGRAMFTAVEEEERSLLSGPDSQSYEGIPLVVGQSPYP